MALTGDSLVGNQSNGFSDKSIETSATNADLQNRIDTHLHSEATCVGTLLPDCTHFLASNKLAVKGNEGKLIEQFGRAQSSMKPSHFIEVTVHLNLSTEVSQQKKQLNTITNAISNSITIKCMWHY